MRTTRFDAPRLSGYRCDVDTLCRPALLLAVTLLFARTTAAQTVAFVAPGESPSPAASRAVLRCHTLLEAQPAEEGEGEAQRPASVEVLGSAELRRALAGLPPRDEQSDDDPLEDVRRLVGRAQGERLRQSLSRLGERVGVDLLVTIRQVGGELELRGFNVERGAFYRGTLMLDGAAPPDGEEVSGFVLPRAGVAQGASGSDEGEARPRRRRRNRWWIWAIVGGAVAAAILVGYLVQPDEAEDRGVTLRIVGP